jgi:hypothetical protein
MSVSFITSSGSMSAITKKFIEKNPTKSSVINTPSIDVVQPLGLALKEYEIEGVALNASQINFFNSMVGNSGSINYLSYGWAKGSSIITPVYFKNLKWKDIGNRAMERTFNITAIEIPVLFIATRYFSYETPPITATRHFGYENLPPITTTRHFSYENLPPITAVRHFNYETPPINAVRAFVYQVIN